MEQFYDERWKRYIFPTDNDLFEHMNDVLMFLEKNPSYGLLHNYYDKTWILHRVMEV